MPRTPGTPEGGVPRPAEIAEDEKTPTPFKYNETEARRLGLEKLEIRAYPEAQRLIEQVIDKTIDLATDAGKTQFVQQWQSQCPDLPMPCVLKNTDGNIVSALSDADFAKSDFWYLTQLQSGKISANLEGDPIPALPQFGKKEVVLADSWIETDYSAPDAATKHTSKLIKALLGQDSIVNIQRQDLDAALWQGDPVARIPTDKHKALLVKLGVDPDQFELRCISQDEYARGATANAWGQKNLWTNFDHYFRAAAGLRNGLDGGLGHYGGPSLVDSTWRGNADVHLAVRLVLARKEK